MCACSVKERYVPTKRLNRREKLVGVTWATGKFYSAEIGNAQEKKRGGSKNRDGRKSKTVGEIKQGVGLESEIEKRKSQSDVRPPKTLH